MGITAQTNARDTLIRAGRSSAVAVAAAVDVSTWASTLAPRVFAGNAEGSMLSGLHRGRLPAVEVFSAGAAFDQRGAWGGVEHQQWGLRIHVPGPSQSMAEERAHRILRAMLSVARATALLRIGDAQVGPVQQGPLAHFVEVVFLADTMFCISTHEGDGGDMGTAVNLPITIQSGSDWSLPFQVFDAGLPLNLTGYSLAAKIRESIGGPLVATLTAAITDAAQGRCVLSLTSAQTAALVPPGSPDPSVRVVPLGLWDCELTSPTAVVTRLFEGSAALSREVTT